MPDAHDAPPVGATVEWYTPPSLFDAMGLRFDLDPASPGADHVPWVPARKHFTIADDGLILPWHGQVWLNPPYDRELDTWLSKLAEHGTGMALVYSRTETMWWQHAAHRADAVLFLAKRVWFVNGETGRESRSQQGSCLMAYGVLCAGVLRHMTDEGHGLLLRR